MAGHDAKADLTVPPILQGLPPGLLFEAMQSGMARSLELESDDILPLEHGPLVVQRGQLALAMFSAEDGTADPTPIRARFDSKQAKEFLQRRIMLGPRARRAERLILHFEPGEFIEPDALAASPGARLFAVKKSQVLELAPSCLESWCQLSPDLALRRQRAIQLHRERLAAVMTDHGALADFYLRHGGSIATTLRVRDLDKCIDCKACEEACQERHGAQRLVLNGRALGRFDLVRTCQSCEEPRCIEVCGYDAIRLDLKKREVIINSEACTGCTLCSLACPYEAITMCELDDQPRLKALLKPTRPAAAQSTESATAPRRLANKCDHCDGFADQACISACPTDALFEVRPAALFQAQPAALVASARDGYAHDIEFDAQRYFASNLVSKLAGGKLPAEVRHVPRNESAQTRWRVVHRALLIGTLLMIALALVEIRLRLTDPEKSALYHYLTAVQGMTPRLARLDISYRPTSALALTLGHGAALLFVIAMLYPWLKQRRLHSPWLSQFSAQQMLRLHMFAGGATLALVGMHSALNLTPAMRSVTELSAGAPLLGFWLLILIGATGLAGRLIGDGAKFLSRLGRTCRLVHGSLARVGAVAIAAHVLFEYLLRPFLESSGLQ